MSAETASLAGDIIFVHEGDGTTNNQDAGITLKDDQNLIGEGVSLVVGLDLGLAPNSITFETLNTQCGTSHGTFEWFLNGPSLGSAPSDPAETCNCFAPIDTFLVTDTSAWNTSANNVFRFVATGGTSADISWTRATSEVNGSPQTFCVFDFAGGDCSELNLCTANFTVPPVDATATLPTLQPVPVTLLAAGNKPSITNTGGNGITLADNNEIRGLTVDGATGQAILGLDIVGTLTVADSMLINNDIGLLIDNFNVIPTALTINVDNCTFEGNNADLLIANYQGNVTVDGSTFGGSTGTAMVFLDTTGNFTSTDTSVERTGGQVFSFQNTDGIFDLTATTVVANDNDEQLFESLLDGVAGTYTFGSVAMTNVFNDGIAVVHSPNAAVGFPNGLTLTNALDDAVVLLDNDNGSFQVTGLNVTAASGRGLFADHLGVGTPPTITINGVSSINATGGAALDIDTASLAATFVSLSSSGSSASGIDVTNSIGTHRVGCDQRCA